MKAAYDREYRAKNREKIKAAKAEWGKGAVKRAYDAQYRKDHAADLTSYKAEWYRENSSIIAAREAKKHAANPEIRRERSRKYAEQNAEALRQKTRAWVAKNPDRKREADSEYYLLNEQRVKDNVHKWRTKNPERKAELDREWRECNSERAKANASAWKKLNAGKVNAATRLRAALKKQQQPGWANQLKIDAVYATAKRLGMHVDHIIPLKSKFVCGLHVETNMQYLSPAENLRKSNKFDPETFECP